MKETPEEKELKHANFLPGKITREGFLGTDTRHIHDIVSADKQVVQSMGVSCEQIAAKMQYFIEEGKKEIESALEVGDFIVQIQWARGMLPCPFGDKPLQHKISVTLKSEKTGLTIKFSQLNVHLIREHCFFLGVGNSHRLEPAELISFLGLVQKNGLIKEIN